MCRLGRGLRRSLRRAERGRRRVRSEWLRLWVEEGQWTIKDASFCCTDSRELRVLVKMHCTFTYS